MKVNKITTIACLVITIISGILLVCYKDNNILQSILSSIFTGFIVSFVVAIIGYFHERAKIIESVDENIKGLFLNITVVSKILGKVLPQIHNSVFIQDLPFKTVSGLAELNSEFIEKMNLGLYSPVCPKSKKAIVCKNLRSFHLTTYNIKNHSSKLEMQVLNYNVLLLEMQKNQMMCAQVNPLQEKSLDEMKNEINISTAKFHEYTTAQSLEVAKIAKDFYGYKKKHLYWNDIEASLLIQAENIVKEDY